MNDMRHMLYLDTVAASDVDALRQKEATYRGSWKRRGGVGAFMMLARKWDRLEEMARTCRNHMKARLISETGQVLVADTYDVFELITCECASSDRKEGADGTALAEVRDLRRYLLLVEAEMMARGVVRAPKATMEELERILHEPEPNVQVLPDGSIQAWPPDNPPPGTPEDGGHHASQPMPLVELAGGGGKIASSIVTKEEPRDGWRTIPPWEYVRVMDKSVGLFYNVDRRKVHMKRPELLRWELNNYEHETLQPCYRGMYDWSDSGEGKWRLRLEFEAWTRQRHGQ